uniref:Uncharacterized protein n=1 Tax=Wuchereria bancrofti TaxID=6293 RepID=A0A1I8EIG2_WUCBA
TVGISKFSYRLASYCGRDLSGARGELPLKTQKSQPENHMKTVNALNNGFYKGMFGFIFMENNKVKLAENVK